MKLAPAFILYAALACLHAPVHSLEMKHNKNMYSGTNIDLGDMAKLAEYVYDLSGVKGWSLKYGHNFGGSGENDKCGIYRKLDTCVFAISGSNDLRDWQQNLAFTSKTAWRNAARDVHNGFASEADGIINNAKYQEWRVYLRGLSCGGGVAVVGHSLGGATASLVAAYANKHTHFTAKYLYTFGAPAVSKSRLFNSRNLPSGCFKGVRFFNTDNHIYADPVPAVTQPLGYRHPKLFACALSDPFFGDLKADEYECTSWKAGDWPRHISMAGIGLHMMNHYRSRILNSRVRPLMNFLAPDILSYGESGRTPRRRRRRRSR